MGAKRSGTKNNKKTTEKEFAMNNITIKDFKKLLKTGASNDGYLDTWNIATRSEEERIEEFLEENDALLKNRDKIPFKYISDIHYGKKTVWKNPDFKN